MTLRSSRSRSNSEIEDEDFLFPVHPAAETGHHGGSHKRSAGIVRLSWYRTIGASFVGIALILLVFVLYISFAHATVSIKPKIEPVSTDISLTIAAEPKGDLAVPGYVLETVVDGSKSFQTKGEGKLVQGKSCGIVTIVNTQTKVQPLVQTTRLLTPENILFRITKSVSVPANGSVDVEACADQPGKAGDIQPTTFTIPGLPTELQKKTFAKSAVSMKGGEQTVSVVTEAEVAEAQKAFEQELVAQAVGKLQGLVPSPDMRNSVFLSQDIVKKDSTAKPGTEQGSYTLGLSVHVTGVFYDPMMLGQAASAALRLAVGQDRDLVSVDQKNIKTTLDHVDPITKEAAVKVSIAGIAAIKGGGSVLDKSKLVGLSKKDAEIYLKTLPFVNSVTIHQSPAWARTLPTLKDHIDVVIEKVQ